MRKQKIYQNNYKYLDSQEMNMRTYYDYLDRIKKICLSIFEWINLPNSMDSLFLEKTLFYNGKASLLKDKKYGFINTKCCNNGYLNIYGLPTKLNCYSYDFNSIRTVYNGLNPLLSEKQRKNYENYECILVRNNAEMTPTVSTIELFAYRLYEAEMTAFTNIKAQKTPVLIIADEKQRLTMENLYNQYNGNQPFIFGDKKLLESTNISVLNTEAPFIADKVMEYKKEIWNELLTFLGINNILVDKKERMITDEANANNELINMNLQSYLVPRQEACKQFNEKYGLTGTDKEISVRVRSDLYNTIKKTLSTISSEIPNSVIIDENNERKENNEKDE